MASEGCMCARRPCLYVHIQYVHTYDLHIYKYIYIYIYTHTHRSLPKAACVLGGRVYMSTWNMCTYVYGLHIYTYVHRSLPIHIYTYINRSLPRAACALGGRDPPRSTTGGGLLTAGWGAQDSGARRAVAGVPATYCSVLQHTSARCNSLQ